MTPALRYGLEAYLPTHDRDYCTLTRMDTIAVGCCLAYLARGGLFRRIADLPSRSAYVLTVVMILLVGVSHLLSQRLHIHAMILHPFVVAACYAATIWIWINHPTTRLGKILNSRPIVWIGLLSYSIYLWQQPFLKADSQAWITQAPINVAILLVLAPLSYFLVERPLLRLKDRLMWA